MLRHYDDARNPAISTAGDFLFPAGSPSFLAAGAIVSYYSRNLPCPASTGGRNPARYLCAVLPIFESAVLRACASPSREFIRLRCDAAHAAATQSGRTSTTP